MCASPCPWFLREVVGSRTFSTITHQLKYAIVAMTSWDGAVVQPTPAADVILVYRQITGMTSITLNYFKLLRTYILFMYYVVQCSYFRFVYPDNSIV